MLFLPFSRSAGTLNRCKALYLYNERKLRKRGLAYLFIDFDETLSDSFVLRTQYVREVGALLAQSYGKTEDEWAKVTVDLLVELEKDYVARFVGKPLAGYADWLDEARQKSADTLFGALNAQVPDNAIQIIKETQFNALTACDAAFPGAYEALDALFQADVRVQLASGNESEYLLAALIGAGIESFTESKFGPDLIDCAKEGPEFYLKIFEATGVAPSDALVVDDQPEALQWAMQAGAKTIQAKISTELHFPDVPGVSAIMTNLRELPELTKKFFG